jgi:hypothetical protein
MNNVERIGGVAMAKRQRRERIGSQAGLELEQLDIDGGDPPQRSNLIADEAAASGVQLRWRHVRDDERAHR